MSDEQTDSRPNRRSWRWVLLLVAGACVAGGWWVWPEGATPGSGKTNVILISIDTLRADHLSCYGYGRETSPSIDRLAKQGVRFATAMTQCPWTLPSHMSMITGMYPHRHGVTTKKDALAADVPTLASILKDSGYFTGALTNSEWLTEKQGFQSGFASFEYVSAWDGRSLINCGEPITDKAIRWIRENEHKPFFLFVHYYDTHSDYDPKERYRKMFVDPSYSGHIDGSTSQLLQIRRGTRRVVEADTKRLVDLYDGEIRQLDDQIGRLMAFLERRGRSKDTVIVLTSDHGEEFMEHGMVLHGRTMFDEIVAIPLILSGPGVATGVEVKEVSQLIDAAPTILSLLGIKNEAAMDGVDLSGYWTPGAEKPAGRYAIALADWNNAEPDIMRMFRTSRFKLIYNRLNRSRKLYDLEKDPGEKNNIAIGHEEITNALMRQLRGLLSGRRKGERAPTPSRETIKRLESLGYL